MTTRQTIQTIRQALEPIYGQHEAESIARMVVCQKLGYNLSQLVAHYDQECEIEDLEELRSELCQGRPVQYVLGEAEFCGRSFAVREGVLIPRQETEEMVMRIIGSTKKGARILDVGTGSGAIAISLAAEVADAEVVAIDISDKALSIAAENSDRVGVNVQFKRCDALGDFRNLGKFDIVVSNPPYIPQSRMESMCGNVVDYEPHTALFVPDDDALCFYRSIARNALDMLNPQGTLWFEIDDYAAEAVEQLLREIGYGDVRCFEDANQKPRVVCAQR